ncbi:MAG: isoaspartyl peptidase/L-asparaginase [Xanthomonadales bacterium]|nr:isoaspartyl peptidase/L-asparaginase [Xanthomonadales bacterium]
MPVWAAEPVLLIHGGAGTILRSDLDAVTEAAIRADLQTALRAGAEQLRSGADADAAVIAAIRVLEESARFNAGKGAVMDAEGGHQLDAAIMRGWNRQAGAVAGLRQTRSPIQAALAVMDHSPHVLLTGTDADAFATTQGLEQVSNDWFDTDFRRGQWERWRAQQQETTAAVQSGKLPLSYLYGTVGAVARDRSGRLAAGTSTGGMTGKRWGRVGDAPIIGAGTWADGGCAVSATGHGEYFIRLGVAQRICERVEFQGRSVASAADTVIGRELTELGGTGGVIVLGPTGEHALRFNTEGMYRGWIDADGRIGVAIYGDEDAVEVQP